MKKEKNFKVTEHKIRQALNTIMTIERNDYNSFPLSALYKALSFMPNSHIKQIVNALSARKLIKISRAFPSAPQSVQITDKAYVYIIDAKKDTFRFWFPVILSISAIIISIVSLIVSILQLSLPLPILPQQ